jgi:hypothetical protein
LPSSNSRFDPKQRFYPLNMRAGLVLVERHRALQLVRDPPPELIERARRRHLTRDAAGPA